ncbi:MAG: DUF1559 domain-containing protein [Armatimonadetes bacterium]|nr:DUF1559 domain-containing protein [Armatimonadota bacterium]
MKRKALSLLELVVVCGASMVLCAILLPLRPAPPPPTCLRNLKMIGLAAMVYFADYDEVLPPSATPPGAGAPPADHVAAITWDELLLPYLRGSPASLHCSCDPRRLPARTYAANAWVMGTGFCHPGWLRGRARRPLPGDRIPDPAATILFAERWDRDPRRVLGRADYHFTWDNPRQYNADHFGGGYVAFADGHAQWLTYQQTVSPRNRWRP